MATQSFPSASISDIEAAIVEQYGRLHIREKSKTASEIVWVVRITPKSTARCIATQSNGSATVTMKPIIPIVLWIVTIGAYFLFIFPGIIMTLWTGFIYFLTGRVIAHRFPKLTENVKRIVEKRSLVES